MRCALCREEAELRKSHVIPEFIYKALYDDKHRFHVLSDQQRNSHEQKGLRERLLCERCEQRFAVHERYVSRLMHGDLAPPPVPQGNTVVFRGVDYPALRMFQLSILWRASVSRLEFFQHVSLGERHEARLRAMLLADDLGDAWQYGCMMIALFHEGKMVRDLIDQPIRRRVVQRTCYRFIFGGLAWLFFVASHRSAVNIETASLDTSGTLRLFKKELSEVKDIAHFSRTLAGQGKV